MASDATPSDASVQDAGEHDAGRRGGVRINEVMSKNEGVWVDERGALEDWIEVYNGGRDAVRLGGWRLADSAGEPFTLPDDPRLVVEGGGTLVLFADDAVDEGSLHLPFKLSASGDALTLFAPSGEAVDVVNVPALAPNQSWARREDAWGDFAACDWATPGRSNGATCGPPPPPALASEVSYAPFTWPAPWPATPRPLALTTLALRPSPGGVAQVEVENTDDAAVSLAGWTLRVAAMSPGQAWPDRERGAAVPLDDAAIAPGARRAFSVPFAALQALEASPRFEGVVTLWPPEGDLPADRVDFVAWPAGATLARSPSVAGRFAYCAAQAADADPAVCTPVAEREAGDSIRHLRVASDWAALAQGGTSVGVESVKWIMDLQAGGVVYLLDTSAWDLHYTFVRERIEGLPHLDRCDPAQAAAFLDGWTAFSQENYFRAEGRRYLLGTLVHTAASGLWTLEFAAGDRITPAQMRRAFFGVMAHVDRPERFAIRPTTPDQAATVRALDGQVPLVDINAPFRGVTWQPLTQTTGYGVLTFVAGNALSTASLGPRTMLVTDRVPNDVPLVGGLVTEDFQTPLAHVNLLSRNRDTPNMALRGARSHPRLAPLFGKLVRVTVGAGDFEVVEAPQAEAEAFWASRRPAGPLLSPRFDVAVRGVVDLAGRGVEDLPATGAKAAQLAELARVELRAEACAGRVPLPPNPFAVPVVHALEHLERSGAAALLEALLSDTQTLEDPVSRSAALAELRRAIVETPVDPALVAEVEAQVAARFGPEGARFRSSSTTEDLPAFNGAGLYTSLTARAGDPDASVEAALQTVWASLWSDRAFDERTSAHVDQRAVAIGVLVHGAFPAERVNGVAISRNILEPLYRDAFINAQVGEASVTNPAQGVTTDQLVRHARARPPWTEYLARSSLAGGQDVLTDAELTRLTCVLDGVHDHFKRALDPSDANRWFAVDVEFKLLGDERALLLKQARPYTFGRVEIPADCREF